MDFNIATYLGEQKAAVEAALDRGMPAAEAPPALLHAAMRHAVFTGGKRLRPILCLAACQAVSGNMEAAWFPALAVELLHTYTLVHDDLPSMDNDALRRGQPTVHVKFGEANAILAGDALQAMAFEFLSRTPDVPSRHAAIDLVKELATAAGSTGVVGGQVLDLEGPAPGDAAAIRQIHLWKTAALFRAALRMGGMAGGGRDDEIQALGEYGESFGLAFQIADDLQDAGKTAGHLTETSCLSALSPAAAEQAVRDLVARALTALTSFPHEHARPLAAVAAYVFGHPPAPNSKKHA